jgi:hypothetical protein
LQTEIAFFPSHGSEKETSILHLDPRVFFSFFLFSPDVPEAVANLHFSYMIMLCAIHEAAPRLNDCGKYHLTVTSRYIPSRATPGYMNTGDKVLVHVA